MSRYGNQYQLSDRAAMELARDRAKELEDLRGQVATLTRERDIIAEELRALRGLTLAYRYQVKHPGTSLDAAIEATRGVIPAEGKQG
jgi:hypothetical protein